MRIDDLLFFAPGVHFGQLNIDSPEIVEIFRRRVEAFYLNPAELLIDQKHAFAVTVVLASAMDTLSYYDPVPPKDQGNTIRFTVWLQTAMSNFFPDRPTAMKFYKDIRCGAVHEGKITKGCVFDFNLGETISVEDGIMAVNPAQLLIPVREALTKFCVDTVNDPVRLADFQKTLKKDFEKELQG